MRLRARRGTPVAALTQRPSTVGAWLELGRRAERVPAVVASASDRRRGGDRGGSWDECQPEQELGGERRVLGRRGWAAARGGARRRDALECIHSIHEAGDCLSRGGNQRGSDGHGFFREGNQQRRTVRTGGREPGRGPGHRGWGERSYGCRLGGGRRSRKRRILAHYGGQGHQTGFGGGTAGAGRGGRARDGFPALEGEGDERYAQHDDAGAHEHELQEGIAQDRRGLAPLETQGAEGQEGRAGEDHPARARRVPRLWSAHDWFEGP